PGRADRAQGDRRGNRDHRQHGEHDPGAAAPSTGTAGARIRHLDRSAKEAGGLQRAANDRFSIDKRIPVNEKDRASAPSPSPELRGPLRAAMASAPWMPGSAPG